MRTLYRWDDASQKFVPVGERTVESRAPEVMCDEMDCTLNHCDGKYYTSKKKYYDAAREAGCVEVDKKELQRRLENHDRESRFRGVNWQGNPNKLRDTIDRVYHELRDGRRPKPETPAHVAEMWRRVEKGE